MVDAFSGCALFGGITKPTVQGPPYEVMPGVLDRDYFRSTVGDIAGHYPKDWLLVNTENIPELDNLIFVYSDPERARALVLTEISGTAELRRNVERDGILALAEASFQQKQKKTGNKLVMTHSPEVFTVNDKLFASYEYSNNPDSNAQRTENRVAVFTTGVHFYELGMLELQSNFSKPAHLENFRLLQSVIGSLDGVASIREDSVVQIP